LHSSAEGEPALMAISRIQNNTGQQLDTDLLVKKIRVALNRTGKIVTSTTIGIGAPEDPLAANGQTRRPDYTLSGKIIELRDSAGDIHQASYVFQLSLSSASGIAVWEDEKTIIKQGSRPSVGF
jgi:PBP1b-binding outer membrane lipoprotein LpoB